MRSAAWCFIATRFPVAFSTINVSPIVAIKTACYTQTRPANGKVILLPHIVNERNKEYAPMTNRHEATNRFQHQVFSSHQRQIVSFLLMPTNLDRSLYS